MSFFQSAGQGATLAALARSGFQVGGGASAFFQARRNAQLLRARSAEALSDARREGAGLLARERVARAASGLRTDVGSPQDVDLAQVEAVERRAFRIAAQFQDAATVQQSQGSSALAEGFIGAADSLLGRAGRREQIRRGPSGLPTLTGRP